MKYPQSILGLLLCILQLQTSIAEITIIGTVALTGSLSSEGQQVKAGAELWVKKVNENGGIQLGSSKETVRLVLEDDESSSSKAVTKLLGLVQQNPSANFILGPVTSGQTAAVLPYTEDLGKLLLAHGASFSDVFQTNLPKTQQPPTKVVGTLPPASTYMQTGLEELYNNYGATSVALMYSNVSSNGATCRGAKQIASSLNYTIVDEVFYERGDLDFYSKVVRLASAAVTVGPIDVVVFCGYLEESIVFLQTLRFSEFVPKAILMKDVVTNELPGIIGSSNVRGLAGPSSWSANDRNELNKDELFGSATQFAKDFKTIAGFDATYRGASAAASLYALGKAIEKSGSTNPSDVRSTFNELELESFYGQLLFFENNNGQVSSKSALTTQFDFQGKIKVVAPSSSKETDFLYPFPGFSSFNPSELSSVLVASQVEHFLQSLRLDFNNLRDVTNSNCLSEKLYEDHLYAQTPTCDIVGGLKNEKGEITQLQAYPGWEDAQNNPIAVNFGSLAFRFPDKTNKLLDDSNKYDAVCVGNEVETRFIANWESVQSPMASPGFQVFAHQETGITAQWPARQYCPNYDPRFRPWYAASASGSKDVVIVLDVSGSMQTPTTDGRTRLDEAKTAAIRVLDTLIEVDFVGVVTFGSGAKSYKPQLVRATAEEISKIKDWVDGVQTAGSTNYEAAFKLAFSLIRKTRSEKQVEMAGAFCAAAILFLSDGAPDSGSKHLEVLETENTKDIQANVFTYGFALAGSGIATMRTIACRNFGIAYKVGATDDLAKVMSGYYQFYAASTETTRIRWQTYKSTETGTDQVKAMLPVYNNNDVPRSLYGVLAFDISLIAPISTLESKTDWQVFQAKIAQDAAVCPVARLSAAEFETLRGRLVTGGSATAVQCEPTDCQSPDCTQDWEPLRCPAGFQAVQGTDDCIVCEKGSFNSRLNRCDLCPQGTFQNEEGQVECLSCYPGHGCKEGSIEPVKCDEGTISQDGVCQQCPFGTAPNQDGGLFCEEVFPGSGVLLPTLIVVPLVLIAAGYFVYSRKKAAGVVKKFESGNELPVAIAEASPIDDKTSNPMFSPLDL